MSEPTEPSQTEFEEPQGAGAASAAPQADVRTFLIADIRGYTTYTRENGDEAAAALVNRFAEIVAEIAAARDGFLLEMRGDEALVAFISARKALRAAVDMQARFAVEKLPRGVGIGLDAGEAIPVGDGYRGTSLNLAARLCAQAAAGETLASEAVMHLAAKIDGIAYVDARDLKLKGYAQSVRAVVVLPSDRAKGHRLATDRRTQSRGAAIGLGAIGALAVIVVLVGIYLLNGRPGPAASSSPTALANATPSQRPTSPTTATASPDPLGGAKLPALAFYDATTGILKGTLPMDHLRNISFFAAGSLWILTDNPRVFHRIDPATNKDVQQVTVPLDEPLGFTVDDDYIWVTDFGAADVVRIDERSGTAGNPIQLGLDENDTFSAFDVAVGAGSAWISRPDVPEIIQIDRDTGQIQHRIPDIYADGLAFGGNALWYWNGGSIGRIDPTTYQETFTPVELNSEGGLGNIYFGGGVAWTTSADQGTVYRVDGSGNYTTFNLEPGVGEMAPTLSTMWITNAKTGVLTGLDIATGQPTGHIVTGHSVIASSANANEIMLAVGPTIGETLATLPGSVLRLATQGFPYFQQDQADPAITGNWQAQQLLQMTCVNLMRYPDKAGNEGLIPEPEAAAGPPDVSTDGRTYTFTIRPGFKFSPPSNEDVTAQTFQHSIERALAPQLYDYDAGPGIFIDIVGAKDYRERKANHVSGLVVNGDKLSITLEAPAPDIIDRLATSTGCAVPINGTPALRSGLKPDPPISSAGPYYLAQTIRKQLLIFAKNPNYSGTRPQPFDEIVVEEQVGPSTALSMIGNGTIDAAMFNEGDPLSGAQSVLAGQWGPGSDKAAAGDQRWFGGPRVGEDFIALNPTSPAFKDLDVRRAVALALDRAALANVFGEAPNGQLLIPSVRGTDPSIVVAPPDIDAAKALLNGRTFDITMLGVPVEWCGVCPDLEAQVTRDLEAIGINVTVRRPSPDNWPGDGALDVGGDIDIASWGTGGWAADPVTALGGLHAFGWLGKDTLGLLDQLSSETGPARVDGIRTLTHALTDEQFTIVPYGYHVFPFFTSDHVGCGFVQQAVGAVDLLSLCFKEGGAATASPPPSP